MEFIFPLMLAVLEKEIVVLRPGKFTLHLNYCNVYYVYCHKYKKSSNKDWTILM